MQIGKIYNHGHEILKEHHERMAYRRFVDGLLVTLLLVGLLAGVIVAGYIGYSDYPANYIAK